MSGIARLLLERGFKVSGSDQKSNTVIEQLQTLGAEVFIGHDAAHLKGVDEVIYSSAIREDNPELMAARKMGVVVLRRAEALAQLMQGRKVIAVTGSHGKTTTASLSACLLVEAGLRPMIAVGGILRNLDCNAYFGDGQYFVAEADESDGTFLCYQPDYSIITNIDYEHLDYYGSFERFLQAVREFVNKTRQGGCLILCYDDVNLRKIASGHKGRCILFGLTQQADIFAEQISFDNLSSEFDCVYKGSRLGRFFLPLGGRHNISNALAVVALGLQLGIDMETIRNALAKFRGARRRMEIKYSDHRYTVIDDYAHHPTEIKATLRAVRDIKSLKRLVVIFQPHRFSRTRLLMEEFARCFGEADFLFLTDIYSASEPPIEGIDGEALYKKIKLYNPQKEIYFFAQKERLIPHIMQILSFGDVVLIMGAGDITRIGDELVEEIKRKG